MKTIEERGQIAGQTYQFCKKEIEADHKIYEKGYIKGATEQKVIDDEEQGKALLYAVHKTTERTKREMIDKTCEWLKEHIYDYIAVGNTDFGKPYDIDLCSDELFKDFKKAVEE